MASRKFYFLISVLAVSACAAPNDELVGTAPPAQSVGGPMRADHISLQTVKSVRPTNNPEPIVSIDGWPFQDESRRFTLTWNSGNEPVVLVDLPSLNGIPVAEAVFKPREVIRWSQTSVGVFRPSMYRAISPVEIEGYNYGSTYRTDDDQFRAELKKGEQVFMYHYMGEGTCLLQVRSQMFESMCPTADAYAGPFRGSDAAMVYQPAERIWWVYLGSTGSGGWMIVDDRVAVDIE
jgi:hypothetical protein